MTQTTINSHNFELLKADGRARRGRLSLKRGVVETPIFMPVETDGSVKKLTPLDLKDLNAQIILGNTYHLFLRRGLEVLEHYNGPHNFIKWDRPILTDSGGFLDIIEGVSRGIDMFDCVMPTRNGRNGTLFTSEGRVNIKNLRYRSDESLLDPDRSCYMCKTFSRGYMRHLFLAGEIIGLRLLSPHNIAYYRKLTTDIRGAIETAKFSTLLDDHHGLWN